MSTYTERDDDVPKALIKKFCTDTYAHEGIIGINLDLNYKQIQRIIKGIYEETKQIKFYMMILWLICIRF